MKRRLHLIIVTLLCLFAHAMSAKADPVLDMEKAFRSDYPGTKHIKEVGPTSVTDLYKVVVGANELYYYPGKKAIFFGYLFPFNEKNYTIEKSAQVNGFLDMQRVVIKDVNFYLFPKNNMLFLGEIWIDGKPLEDLANGESVTATTPS